MTRKSLLSSLNRVLVGSLIIAAGQHALADCPAALSTVAPLGDPAHTAQVMVTNSSSCSAIEKVTATLYANDRKLLSRSFFQDALDNPPLRFPVRDALELPNVAGLYRIEWQTHFSNGELQPFVQTFAIPCSAPAEVDVAWQDAAGILQFNVPPGDICEGKTDITLALRVISGDPVDGKFEASYHSDTGAASQFKLPVPNLEGERRYAADLTLTNEAGLSSTQAFEFVTGCGAISPNTNIDNGRMLGTVDASECQFPITLNLSAVHESGEVVQTVEAVLMGHEFDFALPEFENWPAGAYRIETQFIGAEGRVRHENSLKIACTDPFLTDPDLHLGDGGLSSEVVFDLRGRLLCQDETRVTAQVRDENNVVVFNRAEDVQAGAQPTPFRWSFNGIPGKTYTIDVAANFGVNHESEVSQSSSREFECRAPEILDFAYANPDATHLGALLALTRCNAPASAKIVVQNETGRVVADADPQIVQDVGTSFAKLAPVSLGHLDSGSYHATLVISDNRGRTDQREFSVQRDVDGPEIVFHHNGQQLVDGEIPTLERLSDLVLSFRDTNAPMASYEPYDGLPDTFPFLANTYILRVDGEATPQIWISGTVDLPAEAEQIGVLGLLVRGPSGGFNLAPIVRQYVPGDRAELVDYHPSRRRFGFRSVARVQSLDPGRHDVVGVVVSDVSGRPYLVPGSSSFNVSSLSAQQHDAILRQGVTEIPIALEWSTENTAHLARITSVPDGDYSLSAIGRDIFGNASEVYSRVIRLDQEKQEARLLWPAINGYSQTFTHRFRSNASTNTGPLRMLYRRVGGYGSVRVNGLNVTEQTSEDILTPDGDGVFSIEVELLEDDVDARLVLHADATDAAPLELAIQTYRPEFITQRKRSDVVDTLSIENVDQPCRHVVFDELSQVSMRAREILCAVRLNIPGTSIVSSAERHSEVRLPPGISTDALYEEGFVRVVSDTPTFLPTRQIPIKDIQAYSSTPQLDFDMLPQWRNRASEGHYLTGVGDVVAGHLLVRAGLGLPVVEVNGEPISFDQKFSQRLRVPVRTSIGSLGEVQSIQVRSYYPDTPDLVAEETYRFISVPDRVRVEAIGGQFVRPGDLSMTLDLRDASGEIDASIHGHYDFVSARVIPRDPVADLPAAPSIEMDSAHRVTAAFGDLMPGHYRLQLTLSNTDPRFSEFLAPLQTDTEFEVLDGSPVVANLFTFRDTDKTPFFGQISVDYVQDRRRSDVGRIAWEVSDDGQTFEPLHCCGTSVDFALSTPGSKYYRAQIDNRHSGTRNYTEPLRISAYPSGELNVDGPRHTFRGYPAQYTVHGLPDGYNVLWRVTSPNATTSIETRSATLTIPADETGTYVVEVVADSDNEDSKSRSALRTFFTLEASWPRLPESLISGPTQVEYGKSETYTVTHPPIFKSRGNPAVERVGEWELPDGTRVDDDEWAQFTLNSLPDGYSHVDVLYHSWLEDDKTTLSTAVHRIQPIAYRWPNWKLKVATNSFDPPAIVRLSVVPEKWQDWMGLGPSPISTFWDLPDYVQVIEQAPTEAIVYAIDDRPFSVKARVTDPRGNITELAEENVRPLKQIPFEIALQVVPERTLHTAPIEVTATVDAIVLPKNRSITRVAFYVDGLYRAVSDGSPVKIQIRSPGEHNIRAIASIDNEFSTDDSTLLTLGENHQARCSIQSVGDFRLNGLAKAQCEDPDGHMVEYRWYSNGQLLSDSGTRVQLSSADRLGLNELSLIAVDNAGVETTARFVPPKE